MTENEATHAQTQSRREEQAESDGPRPSFIRLAWPWLVIVTIGVAAVAILRSEGRRWWCACGHAWLWISDPQSSHTSQHLLDPYSFSHISHGLIFCMVLWAIRPLRRWRMAWRLAIAVGIEAAWEIFENSHFVINRYREATMALGYQGDSIGNSLGDIACCILGFLIATRLGWRRSLLLFVTIELVMLITIRDNLTLNVVMLIHPIHAIKVWQMAGS